MKPDFTLTDADIEAGLREAHPIRRDERGRIVTKRGKGSPDTGTAPVPPAAAGGGRRISAPEPYRPLPTDVLPEPLRGFVTAGAVSIGCDAAYLALPLLATCAGMIGNARTVELKGAWHEPSVLWCATVGESGTMKSPAFRLAVRAAMDMQSDLMREYERAKADHEREAARAKAGGEGEPIPVEPTAERIMVADTTTEALALILRDNPRGVVVIRDELAGWVRSFDQYRAKRGADAQQWLSIYNADPLTVDRKSSGTVHVRRAAVSVCGTIQPGILAKAFDEESRESGLAARVLLAWPPARRKRWTDQGVTSGQQAAILALMQRLRALDLDEAIAGDSGPVVVRLTPEAKALWIGFYNAHAGEQAGLTGDLAKVWSKLEAAAARLALVVHCVRAVANDTVHPDYLDADSMAAGIALARWFGREARRIYAMTGETETARLNRHLAELVQRKGGSITPRELVQASREYGDVEAAHFALSELERIGWGRWEHPAPGDRGGRPSRRFVLTLSANAHETPHGDAESEGFVDVDSAGNAEGGTP